MSSELIRHEGDTVEATGIEIDLFLRGVESGSSYDRGLFLLRDGVEWVTV
jgi:hypothetical protein